jgi:O-antigen/teichoic acid export membrane protein
LSNSESLLSGKGVTSIAKNASYLVGTNLLNYAMRFLYVIALTYFLGPELYGLINYGISWYLAFLSFTGFGIAAILSREIGRDKSCGSWIASLTLTFRSVAVIIAALSCGTLGWLFENRIDVRILLVLFSIALVGRSLSIWTQNIFTAYEASQYTFRLQAIFRSFEVIVGIAVLIIGYGATGVVIVHLLSWWLQGLSGLILVWRRIVAIRFNFSWQGLKYVLYQGIPLGLMVVMENWLLHGPLVLFRHFGVSDSSLGQLALSMQAFTIICSVPMAAGAASLPVLSRSVTRQDGKEILFTETIIRASFIFGAFAGITGIGAGPWLVNLIFGIRYLEAGYLLGISMWLLIPFSCAITISRVYVVKGEFYLPMIFSGVGALIMTLIMPCLVAAWNASGALIATATGMVVWALGVIFLSARSGLLDIRKTVFRPIVVIIFGLGVFFLLKPVNNLVAVLSSWTALLCGTLSFGILTKDEWLLISRLKQKLTRS